MRLAPWLVWLLLATLGARAWAGEIEERNWRRIDSKYCTMWLHPQLEAKQVSKRISTWRVRPQIKVAKEEPEEKKLAAKCDTVFGRAQEILTMHPPGIHTSIRVVKDKSEIEAIHVSRYGFNTEAVAFYDFEANTIFVAAKHLSESVIAHEMAHCIIDHYFRIRPPRKIEEMLAMHVDEHLRG